MTKRPIYHGRNADRQMWPDVPTETLRVRRFRLDEPPVLRIFRESRQSLEESKSFSEIERGTQMAHAHILDDMPTGGPRPNKRDNLTMIYIDDAFADLLHRAFCLSNRLRAIARYSRVARYRR